MGDISAAPAANYSPRSYSRKKFPLILRVDARQILAARRYVGDVGIYMPLPGSSKKFVMFAGPSITFATHRYLQSEFGVTPAQSLASGHPVFDAHAGMQSVGVGFSATRSSRTTWLLNIDAALTKLKGSSRCQSRDGDQHANANWHSRSTISGNAPLVGGFWFERATRTEIPAPIPGGITLPSKSPQ